MLKEADANNIAVSVICMAYNHEKYIKRALDSILAQRTEFKYEIIVHDDCSTDNTAGIIKEYEKSYPEVIRAVYEEVNIYSTVGNAFKGICVPKARGKYIAICEGDDYWTNDYKLQIQYDALEENPECDMCACGATAVNACDETALFSVVPKDNACILSIEDVILGGGRYLATATLVYRKDMFAKLMKFECIKYFDYTMQIRGAYRGGVVFVPEKMAAYRVLAEGSWSSKVESNEGRRKQHIEKEILMLQTFDEETEFKYHKAIEKRVAAYSASDDQLVQYKEKMLSYMEEFKNEIYVWGLGIVGNNFLHILSKANISVAGVCDIKNTNVGEKTKEGFNIYSTEYVLNAAKLIIATNSYAYKDILSNENFKGRVVNLQE